MTRFGLDPAYDARWVRRTATAVLVLIAAVVTLIALGVIEGPTYQPSRGVCDEHEQMIIQPETGRAYCINHR